MKVVVEYYKDFMRTTRALLRPLYPLSGRDVKVILKTF